VEQSPARLSAGYSCWSVGSVSAERPTSPSSWPYIISGGIGGVFFLGLGATLWISADLRDEWRKLDRIEEALHDGTLRWADAPATAQYRAGNGVALPVGAAAAPRGGEPTEVAFAAPPTETRSPEHLHQTAETPVVAAATRGKRPSGRKNPVGEAAVRPRVDTVSVDRPRPIRAARKPAVANGASGTRGAASRATGRTTTAATTTTTPQSPAATRSRAGSKGSDRT